MLASRWFLLLVYPYAVKAAECLVGCLVQGISPFDDDNLAVWHDRSLCDSTTVGCEVSTVTYPGSLFQGALWASTSGTEGSSTCTCNICDPYPVGDTTSYMAEETSLWSRIHCYLAASEASGYDVSPCVAAIVDTGTLPCVDDVYEPPTVDQFDCEENALRDLSDSASVEECNWDGDVRMAQEMFSASAASSSTTATGVVVNTNTCLVGCLVQGISPFDEDNLIVWDNRGMCDSNTIGCQVSAVTYPGSLFQGAMWASSWGTDGSTGCTCNMCDPYPVGDTTSYMAEETSLWSRIHCYLAASEASGYDVSPCVAAIVDTGTLPCVDDVYEPPTVDQFDCEENALRDLSDPASVEECNWEGDVRMAQEMFSASAASSSTTATGVVVNTNTCLLGCLVQGISPFDEDNLVVWDNRGMCDSTTIGCQVNAVTYPGSLFQGAMWASSWGTDGSTGCTCNMCDPYPVGDTTSYMAEETSLWSRIHCYLVASEASGYDVSPCVAAIVDTGTLPCVDGVYETPTLAQFDCEENALRDLSDRASVEECKWDGEFRSTDELYAGTRAPSPLPVPTTAPAPRAPSPLPVPTAPIIASDTDGLDNLTPVPLNANNVTPQPGIARTDDPPDPTPAAPPATSFPSTMYPASTPVAPSVTSPPSEGGSALPLEVEGGEVCAAGNTCSGNLCCHPDTSTCGRKYTFCQQRDFADGPRCCSGVEDDPTESNVCSEDSICDNPDGLTSAEVAGIWIGIVTGVISITAAIWKGYEWCKGKQ